MLAAPRSSEPTHRRRRPGGRRQLDGRARCQASAKRPAGHRTQGELLRTCVCARVRVCFGGRWLPCHGRVVKARPTSSLATGGIGRRALTRARRSVRVLPPASGQVVEFQRQQRERDRGSESDDSAREPVDVQLGDSVYEDVPQELRSRLYCCITHREDIAATLRVWTRGPSADGSSGCEPW